MHAIQGLTTAKDSFKKQWRDENKESQVKRGALEYFSPFPSFIWAKPAVSQPWCLQRSQEMKETVLWTVQHTHTHTHTHTPVDYSPTMWIELNWNSPPCCIKSNVHVSVMQPSVLPRSASWVPVTRKCSYPHWQLILPEETEPLALADYNLAVSVLCLSCSVSI